VRRRAGPVSGRPEPVAGTKGEEIVDWKLELIVVPVSDVDRAKAFYAERAGFDLDHDTSPSEGMRVVQLTPPGSACSIVPYDRGRPWYRKHPPARLP
jgi:hypothetical protein